MHTSIPTPSSCLPPPDGRDDLGCACVEELVAFDIMDTSPLASVAPTDAVLFRGMVGCARIYS